MRPRVVIIGGGFGGLNAATALKKAPVDITLVDRRNFHLFQPLLYQVATGGLSPGDITSPIRNILSRNRHTRVMLANVTGVDLASRSVETDAGSLSYDYLIVATGAHHHYFGNEEWERHAPGLKTIEDATEIRRKVLSVFEHAETDSLTTAERAMRLNFVVVGAGPTGVELAGAIAELARDTLRHDFRAYDPSTAVISLIEGSDRVLPGFPPDLSARAQRSLEKLGVTVRLNCRVSRIDDSGVRVEAGNAEEFIPSRCVLWGAGVQASSLGASLSAQAGIPLARSGQVPVEEDLSVAGHPNVFVIGDLALVHDAEGNPLPGVAPVAMQQGKYVARVIRAGERRTTLKPFRYVDKGSLATIGRKAAVAQFGRLHFGGFPAWLLWLGVHLFFLVGFENRVLVFFKWAVNYFSRNRGARLILGRDDTATTHKDQ